MNLRTIKKIDYWFGGFAILFLKPLVWLLGKLLRFDHTFSKFSDVTIVKLFGGGSLVLAYPSLLAFRIKYTKVRLSIVTTCSVAPFAESLDIFDEIITIDASGLVALFVSGAKAIFKVFGTDVVMDLEPYSRLSSAFTTLTAARNRMGFYLEETFWRRDLHTHLVYLNRSAGIYIFYEKMFSLFDVVSSSDEQCSMRISRRLARVGKSAYRICVGCACSELAKERMLTPDQWAKALAEHLPSDILGEVIFLGAKADRALADEIIYKSNSCKKNFVFENNCGQGSLLDSLALLFSCDEFWGIDSALLHYARIFGKKCLSWWGPTDPKTRLKKRNFSEDIIFYEAVPCSPCVHVTETPPCKGDNICIQNLFCSEKREWIGILFSEGQ